MDNELKDNLIKSDLKVRYYEHVKKLLANRFDPDQRHHIRSKLFRLAPFLCGCI